MPDPRVTIGLPVYNGENYLQSAIDSVLAQTVQDFELIISDNASSDRTQEIAEAAAAADPRIRYERQPKNRGAAPNYNRTFELARTPYFKWLAHDDYIEPTFLETCLAVLENAPDAVVASTRVLEIDLDRGTDTVIEHTIVADGPIPHERFRAFMNSPYCYQIFGVIRADVLAKTELIGRFTASDNCLMGVLALHGRVVELPDPLQVMRDHGGRSTRAYPDKQMRSGWFDSSIENKIDIPAWRAVGYYVRGLSNAPLSWWERWRAAQVLLDWVFLRRWRVLVGELRRLCTFELRRLLPNNASP